MLRSDGSFTVNGIPPGSYIVEAISPNYVFEPVRVDISGRAKGKIRARKVNFLQNSAVVTMPYPLKFKVKEPAAFFEKREKWRVTEMLFNPMVSPVPFMYSNSYAQFLNNNINFWWCLLAPNPHFMAQYIAQLAGHVLKPGTLEHHRTPWLVLGLGLGLVLKLELGILWCSGGVPVFLVLVHANL